MGKPKRRPFKIHVGDTVAFNPTHYDLNDVLPAKGVVVINMGGPVVTKIGEANRYFAQPEDNRGMSRLRGRHYHRPRSIDLVWCRMVLTENSF